MIRTLQLALPALVVLATPAVGLECTAVHFGPFGQNLAEATCEDLRANEGPDIQVQVDSTSPGSLVLHVIFPDMAAPTESTELAGLEQFTRRLAQDVEHFAEENHRREDVIVTAANVIFSDPTESFLVIRKGGEVIESKWTTSGEEVTEGRAEPASASHASSGGHCTASHEGPWALGQVMVEAMCVALEKAIEKKGMQNPIHISYRLDSSRRDSLILTAVYAAGGPTDDEGREETEARARGLALALEDFAPKDREVAVAQVAYRDGKAFGVARKASGELASRWFTYPDESE